MCLNDTNGSRVDIPVSFRVWLFGFLWNDWQALVLEVSALDSA